MTSCSTSSLITTHACIKILSLFQFFVTIYVLVTFSVLFYYMCPLVRCPDTLSLILRGLKIAYYYYYYYQISCCPGSSCHIYKINVSNCIFQERTMKHTLVQKWMLGSRPWWDAGVVAYVNSVKKNDIKYWKASIKWETMKYKTLI